MHLQRRKMNNFSSNEQRRFFRPAQQRGLTLVELLVAMVIGLVIVLAAVAALTMARRGFSSVDAASQLRDNGRFAADLIQRLAVQSGYKDVDFARRTCVANSKSDPCPGPAITGANNASASASDPENSWTARSTGTLGYGSDVLVLRYQTSIRSPAESPPVTDGTMIDCAGNPSADVPTTHGDHEFSVLQIAVSSDGEPSLMCTYKTTTGTFQTQPIIRGVENFQVLYGTDGVSPGLAPTIAADLVPDRYLRADQMTVAGNAAATEDNWRRVRSIRIGMILRGPPNSAQDRQDAPTLYPLGPAAAAASGAVGSALSSSADPGSAVLQTAPTDGRLRQVVNFTVHLRNNPGLTP